MTWIATAIAASAVLGYAGASKQSSAAQQAAQTQYQGTQQGMELQKQMFDLLNAQQAPYREAGYGALTKIQDMLPYFTKQPTAADVLAMPGAQFGLTQGLGAVGQGMNALSPGSNVDIARQKFGADYLAQQLYPQYINQQTNIYNRLASLAGLGQAGTAATGQLGQAAGSNLAQLATGGASALAGGQIGAANAMAGGLSNIGNAAFMYGLMRPGASVGAGGGGGIAGGGGITVPSGFELTPSDIRLKTNIVKVGERADGLGLYEFDYKWGGPRQSGLMAHEVAELYPDAVHVHDGYLMVDYSKV